MADLVERRPRREAGVPQHPGEAVVPTMNPHEVVATIQVQLEQTLTTFAERVNPTDRTETIGRPSLRNVPSSLAAQNTSRAPSIADQYSGLLDDLTALQRRGLIAELANGYYDGWRPTRAQLVRYLQIEYGVIVRDHPGSR